jgi:peptide chain release factor subunit 1
VVATVTWEGLRELAGFRAENGCAISLYLDLDPSVTPTAGEVATRLNSLLSSAERTDEGLIGALTHAQREGLRADVERIRRFVDDDFDRDGSRGLAVFAAGLDREWTTLPLSESVPDALDVSRQFHLAPLVPLLGRGDGALVAVVGREQGQLYELRAGRLREVADRSEDTPGRHDQGGWSQARFERHIDTLVERHWRTVAEEIERQVRRRSGVALVLVGSEEIRSQFEQLLSPDARAAVVGWTQAQAHASDAELLERVQPVVEELYARREAETLARWREEAARGGRAAAGWADTLEAASDGRVELLLVHQGADRPAFACPACGRASVEAGSCPLDGATMEQRDAGLDLAVHQTLAHGGSVVAVRSSPDLEPVEGIGALLRY